MENKLIEILSLKPEKKQSDFPDILSAILSNIKKFDFDDDYLQEGKIEIVSASECTYHTSLLENFTETRSINKIRVPNDTGVLIGNKDVLQFNVWDYSLKFENDFKNFIERYSKRIESFRNYLNGNNFIDFVLVRYNSVPYELENIIKEKYPNLKFKIHTISRFTNNNIGHLYNCTIDGGVSYEMDYLEYMGINQNNNPMEIKRYLSDFNNLIGDINGNITII